MSKICSSCKDTKDLHLFNTNKNRKGGLDHYCKDCRSLYDKKRNSNPVRREQLKAASRRYTLSGKATESRKNNIEKARLKEALFRIKYAERIKKYAKEYAKTYKREKVKQAARTILNNAVSRGKMLRPLNCEQCEQELPVQGHHEDYSKPLDVIWLCVPCHGKAHRHYE